MPTRLRPDVLLGPLTEKCAIDMLSWMQDADVSDAIGLSQTPTLERTLAWIAAVGRNAGISVRTILYAGEYVGNVVFDQFDRKAATARLSVYIGKRTARGQGVGTTGIYRALTEIFHKQQLHKVWLTVHTENTAAIRVYRELGFQVEGRLRDAFVLKGRRVDALYMGLLATEFPKRGSSVRSAL